jgi:hypothetical protein
MAGTLACPAHPTDKQHRTLLSSKTRVLNARLGPGYQGAARKEPSRIRCVATPPDTPRDEFFRSRLGATFNRP